MKTVILAGGLGTRISEESHSLCSAFHNYGRCCISGRAETATDDLGNCAAGRLWLCGLRSWPGVEPGSQPALCV